MSHPSVQISLLNHSVIAVPPVLQLSSLTYLKTHFKILLGFHNEDSDIEFEEVPPLPPPLDISLLSNKSEVDDLGKEKCPKELKDVPTKQQGVVPANKSSDAKEKCPPEQQVVGVSVNKFSNAKDKCRQELKDVPRRKTTVCIP